MTRILLAVLAIPVVAAVAVLVAIARLARQMKREDFWNVGGSGSWGRSGPHFTFNTGDQTADDSEVVGMPTVIRGVTWGQSGPHLTFNTGLEQPRPIDWDGILSGAVVPDHERMN